VSHTWAWSPQQKWQFSVHILLHNGLATLKGQLHATPCSSSTNSRRHRIWECELHMDVKATPVLEWQCTIHTPSQWACSQKGQHLKGQLRTTQSQTSAAGGPIQGNPLPDAWCAPLSVSMQHWVFRQAPKQVYSIKICPIAMCSQPIGSSSSPPPPPPGSPCPPPPSRLPSLQWP
jgi:hypothetical protein